MCVLSIKVPIRKKSGNLSYAPGIYIYIYIYTHSRNEYATSPVYLLSRNHSISIPLKSFFKTS